MNTKIINFFIIFWLIVIPLSYNFWGIDPALFSKFFLLDISLLGALLFLCISKSELPVPGNEAKIFFGLYGLSVALSAVGLCLYGFNKADGWFQWPQITAFPLFVYVLLIINRRNPISKHEVAGAISYLALFSLIIGLAQYTFQDGAKIWALADVDVVKATYGHKNIFSEVLLLTLPFSYYAYYSSSKRWFGWIATATILAIIFLLSRAVWLGAMVGGLITFIVYDIVAGKQRFRLRWVLGFAGLLALTIISGYWVLHHTGAGAGFADFYNKRDTINERQHLWHVTLQLIKSYPFFGSGLASWKILSMRYSLLGLRDYSTFFQQPHNDTLWIISEQGIFSFLALSAAWLYLLYLLLKRITKQPGESFNYCLLFALSGYWMYSNFGFPRERAEHGIILSFIAFFILSGEEKKSITIFPKWSWVFIFIPLVCATWWAGNKLVNEYYMGNALGCRMNGDAGQELTYLHKINPTYFALDETATPVAWYVGMIHYAGNNIPAATADFQEALKYNPYHAYSLANMGTCLTASGQPDSAEKYFRQTLEYSTGFPDAALNLCALKFNKGETDSAAYYLALANDTLSDVRYVRFMNVVIKAELKPIYDTATANRDTLLLRLCKTLMESNKWQNAVLKKAKAYKKPVHEQILKDMVWVIGFKEKKPALANQYQKLFNLATDE